MNVVCLVLVELCHGYLHRHCFVGIIAQGGASSGQQTKIKCLAGTSTYPPPQTSSNVLCASIMLDLISRGEVDQRAHVRAGVESVSDSKGPDSLSRLGDKRVVDPLLDHETVRGNADLSTEAEFCSNGPINGTVEVGVVENLCTHLSDKARLYALTANKLERHRGSFPRGSLESSLSTSTCDDLFFKCSWYARTVQPRIKQTK